MNNKEYTVSEVIDSFGMNKHTWLMFMLLALAMILDGYDFMVVNSTNMFVAHTFWPDNPNPGALMGSLTTWGGSVEKVGVRASRSNDADLPGI